MLPREKLTCGLRICNSATCRPIMKCTTNFGKGRCSSHSYRLKLKQVIYKIYNKGQKAKPKHARVAKKPKQGNCNYAWYHGRRHMPMATALPPLELLRPHPKAAGPCYERHDSPFLPNHPNHVNQWHLTVARTSEFAEEVQLPTTMANDMNHNPIKLLYFRWN